jgi:hypothetical protein
LHRRSLCIVGLVEDGVQPLQHPLGDAGGLPKPDRHAEDKNVRRENALSQIRPFVSRTFVAADAGFDVVIRHAHDFALDAVEFHRGQHVTQQLVGRTQLIS